MHPSWIFHSDSKIRNSVEQKTQETHYMCISDASPRKQQPWAELIRTFPTESFLLFVLTHSSYSAVALFLVYLHNDLYLFAQSFLFSLHLLLVLQFGCVCFFMNAKWPSLIRRGKALLLCEPLSSPMIYCFSIFSQQPPLFNSIPFIHISLPLCLCSFLQSPPLCASYRLFILVKTNSFPGIQ